MLNFNQEASWIWSAKVGRDAQAYMGDVCGLYCNAETNERCPRILDSQN